VEGLLREGIVTDEFIRLAQSPGLTAEEQVTFTGMKQALADQLMRARPAASDALDEE